MRIRPFAHPVGEHRPVKDIIESLGVSSDHVDMILVNGESVDLGYVVQEGDRVSVYPVFESFDISSVTRIRPRPLRRSRFVLDVHLGKLSSHLRMLGFDTLYRNDFTDETLLHLSNSERRILLSRDRQLLSDERITRGYLVQEKDPFLQVKEVLRRFDLFESIAPFQRCLCCNGLLEAVRKDAIMDRLPPRVSRHFEEFQICSGCNRVYWKGSHYGRMQMLIRTLLAHDRFGEDVR
jgi:hypothetical protein